MKTDGGHDALLTANRLIQGAKDNNQAFTPVQLIKMVYIAHGWMLGLFGRSLITQPVEAWKYGPVIADVYFAIKHYRNNPVNEFISGLPEGRFDQLESALIDKVRKVYGQYSGIKMSAITHEPGTPWYQVTHDRWYRIRNRQQMVGQNIVIPNPLIAEYYRKRVENRN